MGVLELKIESTPYTYVLEWTVSGKRYIGARWAKGCHPEDLWNSYFTSSKYVEEHVKIYGDPDIILIDKVFNTSNEAREREIFLLNKFNIKTNDSFLNKAIGGRFDLNDPEIRKKMKNSHLGKKATPEWVEWVTQFHRTRIRKPETYKKISKALTGKKHSKERCVANSLAKLGNTYKKGAKLTEEQKERCRVSQQGKLHSEETKNKMSQSRRGKAFKKVICPHCKKEGGITGMKRWHFDKCKNIIQGA